MRPAWLTRVLFLGAFAIAAGVFLWLAFFGRPALFPPDSTNSVKGNFIALALGQSSGAGWGWVRSDRNIDPSSHDTVVLRFWVSTDDPEQASFILGGPMIKYLHTCYGNGTQYAQGSVSYTDLNATERDVAQNYWLYSPEEGLVNTFQGNKVMDPKDAQRAAESGRYVRITSDSFTPDARTYTPGSGAERSVAAREYSFACSFAPQAFWTRRDGQDAFTFPSVLQEANFQAAPDYEYLNRQITFTRDGTYSIAAIGDPPDFSNSGTVVFDKSWDAWDYQGLTVQELNQFSAVFKSTNAESDRQILFLWVGAAVALVGTLILAMGKHLSDLLAAGIRRLVGKGPDS